MADAMIDLYPIQERIGALVKREAIRMCPVDRGELRASIDFRIEGNKVILYATAAHADEVEYGRPPSILSETEKDDLREWAKRHKANPGKIINYIQKKGIKVGTPENPLHITSYNRDSYRPFMRSAVHQSLPRIKEIIKKGVKK